MFLAIAFDLTNYPIGPGGFAGGSFNVTTEQFLAPSTCRR
jgi:hypothetical protein